MWKKILIGLIIILGIYWLFFRSTKEHLSGADIKKTKYFNSLNDTEKKQWRDKELQLINMNLLVDFITDKNERPKKRIDGLLEKIKSVLNIDYYKPIEYSYVNECKMHRSVPGKLLDNGLGKLVSTYINYNITLVPNPDNRVMISDFNKQLVELIVPIEHFILVNIFRKNANVIEMRNKLLDTQESLIKPLYEKNMNIIIKDSVITANVTTNSVASTTSTISELPTSTISGTPSTQSSLISSPFDMPSNAQDNTQNDTSIQTSSYDVIMKQFETPNININDTDNINIQEHFSLELPDEIIGNIMKNDLSTFEKDYIEIAKNRIVDKNINDLLNTLYNVNFDLNTIIDIDQIDRLQKQKLELEKIIDKVDFSTKIRFENNIKDYNDKIASLLATSVNDAKKKKIINQLKSIKPDIDLSNIKNDMISIKKYIDELEQKLIQNTGSNKADLLFCFSAILILFRNINEWLLCF